VKLSADVGTQCYGAHISRHVSNQHYLPAPERICLRCTSLSTPSLSTPKVRYVCSDNITSA
jgi:hypothetical protein